ncbi:hypothetical protein C2S52_002593 [Perilla frutescens var. hirtella]|nr:hypothetical protein C2S51_012852 [Perilla frutescens var. frutescens]KAH6792116.1 hypothetical protein C2S52_002593 [Perilla frutescens var. hirtella]
MFKILSIFIPPNQQTRQSPIYHCFILQHHLYLPCLPCRRLLSTSSFLPKSTNKPKPYPLPPVTNSPSLPTVSRLPPHLHLPTVSTHDPRPPQINPSFPRNLYREPRAFQLLNRDVYGFDWKTSAAETQL